MSAVRAHALDGGDRRVSGQVTPALSVIVPVYDQAGVIADNVRTIRERIAAGFDEPFEVIVVSDGSVDGTAERVLESELPNVRVLYYDRNLGKGYAVKTGAREARGRWVAYIDADLDLDPAGLPGYVEVAERDGLDFAIGSKRHPDSKVHYPRSRVFTSWIYQVLVRVLFHLDVRDTQVGMKVFRREVAREVMPLLLVKRYAFDIELLAVGRAFGFDRVREMPIALDYQFTGSGVRSLAVAPRRLRHSRGVLPAEDPRLLPAATRGEPRLRLGHSRGVSAARRRHRGERSRPGGGPRPRNRARRSSASSSPGRIRRPTGSARPSLSSRAETSERSSRRSSHPLAGHCASAQRRRSRSLGSAAAR